MNSNYLMTEINLFIKIYNNNLHKGQYNVTKIYQNSKSAYEDFIDII